MKINYHNRVFKSVSNSSNGEVSAATTFHYQQQGNIVTATYAGGGIVKGQLIAIVNEKSELSMSYQHINQHSEIMTGRCQSVPEMMESGKIRLHETWEWTSGDKTSGQSVIEEI